MRRRLLFARAFLHKPRVLLLDEPLANLDVSGQATVKEVLQKARGNGAAILYTSPGLHQAPFADRIVILERGKVVSTGNVEMK
jgi:ABC-2 type transport system ATP-binding protein